MACLSEAQKEARKRNRLIENKFRGDRKELRQEIKLLLLGAGESGKSTIVKQMRIIHGEGYSEADKVTFIPLIFENIHKNITVLLEASEEWGLKLQSSNEALVAKVFDYDKGDKAMISKFHSDFLPAIISLWKDPAIQQVYARRNELQLNDSAKYYFDRASAIGVPNYMPTEQDILRSRVATTGIFEFTFGMKDDKSDSVTNFRMIDVGGQRSERRKWIHCFADVTSITFIAAVSSYDQVCIEDGETNRMAESIGLWEQIVNYAIFSSASMILFFNKVDLLEEKVKEGKNKIEDFFADFAQFNAEFKLNGQPNTLEACKAFFHEVYKEHVAPDIHGNPREVYEHFTTALDTKNIEHVIESVRNTILENNLRAYAVL